MSDDKVSIEKAKPKKGLKSYRALTGLQYPDPKKPGSEKRVEAGTITNDIPPKSISWLLSSNAIEEVD